MWGDFISWDARYNLAIAKYNLLGQGEKILS